MKKKQRKRLKKKLRRFAWDITVGATGGFLAYLLAEIFKRILD